MRNGARCVAMTLLLVISGCASAPAPPLTGVYKRIAAGNRTFEYRYISCAPIVKFENSIATLENVEVTGITNLTVKTISEDERRFFIALGLFNNWMVLTCQTITLLGSKPELVVQYSKTRDEIVLAFLQDYALRQGIGQTSSLNYNLLAKRIESSALQTEKLIPSDIIMANVPKVYDPTRGDA